MSQDHLSFVSWRCMRWRIANGCYLEDVEEIHVDDLRVYAGRILHEAEVDIEHALPWLLQATCDQRWLVTFDQTACVWNAPCRCTPSAWA